MRGDDGGPDGGDGRVVMSALDKFGLTDDVGVGGKRKIGVSDLAAKILLTTKSDTPERYALLREAALNPQMHRETWAKYGGRLPADETIIGWLRFEKQFTDFGAAEFISEFKKTIAYARLTADATLPLSPPVGVEAPRMAPSLADAPPDAPNHAMAAPRAGPSAQSGGDGMEEFRLPIRGKAVVVVRGNFPLTPKEWEQMIGVLTAMKPGLVEEPSDD